MMLLDYFLQGSSGERKYLCSSFAIKKIIISDNCISVSFPGGHACPL